MTEQVSAFVWLALAGYLAVGAVVAVATLLFGLGRLDPAAAQMPVRVRLLIAPGLTALWPLIIARLLGARAREDRL